MIEITAANACTKCSGKGCIRGFEHIANGECFQCAGTGLWLSRADRAKIAAQNSQKRLDAHDAQVAKECGLTLKEFRHVSDPKRYPRLEGVA